MNSQELKEYLGNTIIVKCDEFNIWIEEKFIECGSILMQELFKVFDCEYVDRVYVDNKPHIYFKGKWK